MELKISAVFHLHLIFAGERRLGFCLGPDMKLSRLTACGEGIQPEGNHSWSANSTIAIRIHRPQSAVWIDRERSNGHLAMVIVVRCDVVVWQVIRQIPTVAVLAYPLLDRFLTAG